MSNSETNPLLPIIILSGAYYYMSTLDNVNIIEDEEYPMSHIILYCGFLYYMRDNLVSPEVLAIMAPLAASNLARAAELSYVKSTLVGLAVILFVRHIKGDMTAG